MKNNYFDLMREHCMDMNNYTNLEMLYEDHKIIGFEDFQHLKVAVDYLLANDYLECNNQNKLSVMITEKGKNIVENNFVYQTVEIIKSKL